MEDTSLTPPSLRSVRYLSQFLIELMKVVVLSVLIIVPIRLFLVQPFYVQGKSMEPNFIEHDYLLIDEITYGVRNPATGTRLLGGRDPERGEIVVFSCDVDRCGRSKGDYLIKRVVGLPGETIEIRDGSVWITPKGETKQQKLAEPYINESMGYFQYARIERKLGSDEYFVLGDNRDVSFDSEDFGPIPKASIIGRVWVRGWPFNRLRQFDHPLYEGLQ